MIFLKLPFSPAIFTVKECSTAAAVTFVPFVEGQPVHFNGVLEEVKPEELQVLKNFSAPADFAAVTQVESEYEYRKKVAEVIHFVKENHLEKLVLSRRKNFHFPAAADYLQTFHNLCANYPEAFIYIFEREGASWMGAFSELLGSYDKYTGVFRTMSLAATLPLNEDWTKKEIEEQQPVTDFIRTTLEQYSTNIIQGETRDHLSGPIKHLRTDFTAEVSPERIEELISDFHPTPAVCGIPNEICIPAITEFEAAPRELYAGYTKVETAEALYYFVNLRCAKLYRQGAQLFVGGGITADSDAAKEWQETELKSEALLRNLAYQKY